MATPPLLAPAVLRFLRAARVARLATADAAGRPSLVPVCFQVQGTRLFTPIDAKPKRADWRALRRVRNVLARPTVALLVDRWDEDWRRLAWVHLRGRAALLEQGPLHAQGIALLRAKYAQYGEMALEERPLIVVALTAATHWGDLSAGPAPEETPRP
jgi:PPOX class probable F420-dependent enzyme